MYRLLSSILVVILATGVFAQTEEVVTLKDFGPLNTKAGPFSLSPTAFVKAHNVDFGRVGAIRSRVGYDSVSYIPGIDSMVNNGLFPAYYSDGTQRLFAVTDSTGVGYGNIYITSLGSATFGASPTRIITHWPITEPAEFAQYQNDMYIVNGAGGGGLYSHNDQSFRRWPVPAPGEPLIVPLNTSGNLNGEYRYYLFMGLEESSGHISSPTDSGRPRILEGYLSSQIRVNDGQALLTNFSGFNRDSLHLTDRRTARYTVNSLLDNTLYWITVNTDSVGYTSDGTATKEEIIGNLITLINADSPGMADSVTAFLSKLGLRIYSDTNTIDFTMGQSSNLTIDSAYYNLAVYRGSANKGFPDKLDSVFAVSIISVLDTAILDTLTIIDNVADDPDNYIFPLFTDLQTGRDSLGAMTTRYGSPGYISGGEVTGADTATRGVYAGWIDTDTTSIHGMAYACTFIDTVTGIESDTGRSLFIFNDQANRRQYMSYTISLPKLQATFSGMKINIYRAPVFLIGEFDSTHNFDYDTTSSNNIIINIGGFDHVGDTIIGGRINTESIVSNGGPFYRVNAGNFTDLINPTQLPTDEFQVGRYRWIGRVDVGTETFADSARYDSVLFNPVIFPIFVKQNTPFLPKNVFSFQNRLWFTHKSRLYYSNLDLQLLNLDKHDFGDLDFVPITEDDGDEITFAYPEKDYIVVYKNRSRHIVYEKDLDGLFTYNVDGVFFTSAEVTDHRGLVAARSFVHTPHGNLFMSQEGIVQENRGQQLERTTLNEILSAPLDNFDSVSLSTLAQTVGFYYPRGQQAMFSLADTTYVYDFRAGSWATWDRLFNATALYGVESNVDFIPGDTMYFARGGDNNIYRFGTSLDDNGDSISVSWKFAPLKADPFRRTITRIGVWADATNATDGTFLIRSYNSRDSLLDSTVYNALDTKRYRLRSFPSKSGLFHSLEMGSTAGNGLGNIVFDRFDIFMTNHGLETSE